MPATSIRIVTRKSPLAVWQAEHVASRLRAAHPGLEVALIGVTTTGDKILDAPLAKIGGKGLFVKELEQCLLDGSADLAVHSMKDVPVELPEGLAITVVLEREDPRDAFISKDFQALDALPQGARIGTASLRRQCQLLARRPDLIIEDLRGNVGTRLSKLDNGEFAAIILAAAGIKRLGLETRVAAYIDTAAMLPAIGQGAIGVECRHDDAQTQALLGPLDHPDTHVRIDAERALNHRLQGGCQVPIAAHAVLEGDNLTLRALVGKVDGSELITGVITGHRNQAKSLGIALAEDLLKRGAADILQALKADVAH